jgi:PST family polysaccharide transporter
MTPALTREPAGRWKPLLHAMSVSALSAVASGALSALSSKIIAVMLGPAALAILATLQQVRQTAVTAATANGQTALIQGSSSLSGSARREYVRTVALIFAVATALAASVLVLLPVPVARWSGLGAETAGLIRWLALAVVLSSLFVFLLALLNATGAIGKLSLVQIAGPAAMALAAWPVARLGSQASQWFPAMLATSAAVTAGSAALALRGELPRAWFNGPGRLWGRGAARHFFSISGAMLVTGLAGSAALIAVRARILEREGLAVTGQFDAAWTISMNQVTLVLASLQTYYLPALARLSDPEARSKQIARVLTVAAPAAAAGIAIIACSKLLMLRMLYSSAFLEASHYLRWTLLGDYLKVTSWILSIPMLASAHMRIFVAADLSSTAAFVVTAVVLSRWRSPAESAAIAFVAMHAVHLSICALYIRRFHAFRWRAGVSGAWLAGLALAGAASAWSWNS